MITISDSSDDFKYFNEDFLNVNFSGLRIDFVLKDGIVEINKFKIYLNSEFI